MGIGVEVFVDDRVEDVHVCWEHRRVVNDLVCSLICAISIKRAGDPLAEEHGDGIVNRGVVGREDESEFIPAGDEGECV